MKFGITLPQYAQAVSPEGCVEVAKVAERLGYDSVWLADHVVTPPTFASAYGPGFMDPFVLMGYLASVTERVDIGTAVIVVPSRNPLAVASMLATADKLSGGRIIFGAGAGWDREEFEALGVPFEERGAMTDEYLAIMRALWTEEAPAFDGRYFRFANAVMAPKPVRPEGVRVWIGGNAPAAQRRAVRSGDAWHPSNASRTERESGIVRIRELCEASGRAAPPAMTLRLDIRLALGNRPDTPRPWCIRGKPAEVAERIGTDYAGLGLEHLGVDMANPTWEQMVESIDAFARDVIQHVAAL